VACFPHVSSRGDPHPDTFGRFCSRPKGQKTQKPKEQNMKKFYVTGTDTNTYYTEIEASSPEDAVAKADDLWKLDGADSFVWLSGGIDNWEVDEVVS
jgi:hypothetical protein